MRIAFVSIFNPADIHAWSGLGVNILNSLQESGFQIETIGALKYHYDFIYKLKEVLYSRLFSRTYKMLWDPILLKSFASQIEHSLVNVEYDILFSIWTNPIAYLRVKKPIVFWGDAMFYSLMNFYPSYSNLCAETIRGGNQAETLALSKCQLAIYSSKWAAQSAIQDYGINLDRVKVVPFGANINCQRSIYDIQTILQQKNFDVCRLLFVGVDWSRKGGDIALNVATSLNQRGIPTELHIVGCEPEGQLPSFVKQHGFVSKQSEGGKLLLDNLFSQSHFLILPTRADCTPVVFPEANSFGLPVLTTNVGGIPTIIRDGMNGFMFSLQASPEMYCNTIEELWSSKEKYNELSLSSFREYSERLNWKTIGQRISDLLYEYCS